MDGWRRAGIGVALVLLVGVIAATVLSLTPWPRPRYGKPLPKTAEHIRTLLVSMIERRVGCRDSTWAAHSGKNFVLSVLTPYVSVRRREYLALLWPAGQTPADLGPEDYEAVTAEALRTRRFPHLTGFAGRRNAEAPFWITPEQESLGTPLIAAREGGGVWIGFSGGDVRFYDREGLGLPAGAPIVFGDAAPEGSMLRMLSEE